MCRPFETCRLVSFFHFAPTNTVAPQMNHEKSPKLNMTEPHNTILLYSITSLTKERQMTKLESSEKGHTHFQLIPLFQFFSKIKCNIVFIH
jgi:uncharacterized membrane protein